MSKNDPAFPNMNYEGHQMGGLTKREYFAAMAMQGMWANTNSISALEKVIGVSDSSEDFASSRISRVAVMCADALLAELEKQNQEACKPK